MSLRDNVNNTNIQKNKLKTGKQNIDNKIISLGGTKSTSIADVPNKIQAVTEQFSRVAFVSCEINTGKNVQKTITYNLSFTPRIVVFRARRWLNNDSWINPDYKFTARQNITGQEWLGFNTDVHVNATDSNPAGTFRLKVTEITNKTIKFTNTGDTALNILNILFIE